MEQVSIIYVTNEEAEKLMTHIICLTARTLIRNEKLSPSSVGEDRIRDRIQPAW